jgi:hypothetical protein
MASFAIISSSAADFIERLTMVSAILATTKILPSTDDIKQSMEVAASSPEAAEYLVKQVTALIGNSKVVNKSPELKAKAQKVIDAVQRFADFVTFKHASNAQPWSGQTPPASDFSNMQESIARDIVKQLGGLTSARIDYAINKEGHFVRGYTSEGKLLDTEATGKMDKLFNAWLASHGITLKGGFLYKASAATQDESSKISADTIAQLIADPVDGVVNYMDKKGVEITLKTREYPGTQKEAEIKRSVEAATQAVESAAQPVERPAVAAAPPVAKSTDETPEGPQTGTGAF